jgi:Ni,Fe-hydrogenase I large subunit
MKEDLDTLFNGYELSEDFKETASTLFEAALNARIIAETTRLEEEFAAQLEEQMTTFSEEMVSKIDSYLNYAVENFMKENEVAIESALRNELTEEFIEGLKNLFAEHYISIPQEKVDVLEALAEKVEQLESKLDEVITENTELRGALVNESAKKVFEELASDLALTQQEKFAALAEGIEYNGDLETYAKKLSIIKENYFKNESQQYSSNIEEETFEGEISESVNVDPVVSRYVQAIARTVKK